MDENMDAQRIEQLTKNSEFIEKARNADSVEAFRELLAGEGIEIDAELFDLIASKAGRDEELHEQDLEDISGGMIVGPSVWLLKLWKSIQNGGATIHTSSSGSSHGGGGRRF